MSASRALIGHARLAAHVRPDFRGLQRLTSGGQLRPAEGERHGKGHRRLVTHPTDGRARGARRWCYVSKHGSDSELIEAIRRVAAGQRYVDPDLGAQLAVARTADWLWSRSRSANVTFSSCCPRPHQPGSQRKALRVGPNDRFAPGPHHAQVEAADPGRVGSFRARERFDRAVLMVVPPIPVMSAQRRSPRLPLLSGSATSTALQRGVLFQAQRARTSRSRGPVHATNGPYFT